MKKYLVGGIVRDHQLGLKAEDRDWVIVGATQNDISRMVKDGYTQVGKDFPVFLHPNTGEEYALARTERKTGLGYNGFECDSSPVITLEEDLLRRDLTINAMAYDPYNKKLIDPYGGSKDLENKTLRHVSPAFTEDPVRVLRTARFAARYNFTVHESTKILMQELADSGELDNLTSERVFEELKKVSEQAKTPSLFFKVLQECGALEKIFLGLKITNEGFKILDKAVVSASSEKTFNVMMAALLYDSSDEKIKELSSKLKLPSNTTRFIMDAKNIGPKLCCLEKMDVEDVVNLFDRASLRNKGGEEYTYLLLDIQYSYNKIQRSEYDIVMKFYDMYYSVDLSDIDDLCKEKGAIWVKTELKNYIFDKKVQHIKKLY